MHVSYGILIQTMQAYNRESVGAAGWKNTADTINGRTGVDKVRTTKGACWGDRVGEHRKHARETQGINMQVIQLGQLLQVYAH